MVRRKTRNGSCQPITSVVRCKIEPGVAISPLLDQPAPLRLFLHGVHSYLSVSRYGHSATRCAHTWWVALPARNVGSEEPEEHRKNFVSVRSLSTRREWVFLRTGGSCCPEKSTFLEKRCCVVFPMTLAVPEPYSV